MAGAAMSACMVLGAAASLDDAGAGDTGSRTVTVKSKSTAKVPAGPPTSGGDYTGKVSWTKVTTLTGGKTSKKVAGRAREACAKLFAKGTTVNGRSPRVRLLQRHANGGPPLRLNDQGPGDFSRSGKWEQYGVGPSQGSDPNRQGQKIDVVGTFWDSNYNSGNSSTPTGFSSKGKAYTAECEAFTAVIDPQK